MQMEVSNGTVRAGDDEDANDQRKASGIPTLMITVKNEMAQTSHEQTIPTAGKTIDAFGLSFHASHFRFDRNCDAPTHI